MGTKKLTESSVVVVADNLTSAEVDGEMVILDLEDGLYYGLNPVGARIWDEIQEPTSVKNLTSTVAEKYDVEYDRCLDDVMDLLGDMNENDLIVVEKSE